MKNLIVIFLILTLGLLIVFIDTVGSRGGSPVEDALNFLRDVGGLLSRGKSSMEGTFTFLWTFLETQGKLAGNVSNLELEISKLKIQNNILTNQVQELKRIESASGFREVNKNLSLIGARIIRREPAQWLNTALLDRGKADGIKPNMAVISEAGLVGKIISVSTYTSRILFILDPGNTVSVKVMRNNVMGVLKGDGKGGCNLLYIPSGADVKVGDIISTSEASEIYPSGIQVGRISNISSTPGKTFLDITVIPAVDFSSIYYLWIVK